MVVRPAHRDENAGFSHGGCIGKTPRTVMTVSLLRAYVIDWWFLNHIDNIALTETTGKPYPVKKVLDNVALRAVNRRMSSWPALGTSMHHV
ncbi:hypothetical protein PIB30_106453, partial [Stylosanthes scabra]|nr:hypothetical protein [Stylosanthes scabra]